ncbi:hypothetical protein CYMTET_27953, partial [Cymbomonas tetramitiformis]
MSVDHALTFLADGDLLWCSWCLVKSSHIENGTSALGRGVYKCDRCERRTLNCLNVCGATTQGGSLWDNIYCLVCNGDLIFWPEKDEIEVAPPIRSKNTTSTPNNHSTPVPSSPNSSHAQRGSSIPKASTSAVRASANDSPSRSTPTRTSRSPSSSPQTLSPKGPAKEQWRSGILGELDGLSDQLKVDSKRKTSDFQQRRSFVRRSSEGPDTQKSGSIKNGSRSVLLEPESPPVRAFRKESFTFNPDTPTCTPQTTSS